MTVDIAKLRPLIELLHEGGVLEFEHESDGEKIRIIRGFPQPAAPAAVHAPPVYAAAYAPAAPPGGPPRLTVRPRLPRPAPRPRRRRTPRT